MGGVRFGWDGCTITMMQREMASFCRRYFQMNFRKWQLYSHSNLIEMCSQWSNQQQTSIDSDDGWCRIGVGVGG